MPAKRQKNWPDIKWIGDKNQHRQILVRQTDAPGTDKNSKIWVLRCSDCGYEYGANGTDAWQRKCPKCQGGKPGLLVSESVSEPKLNKQHRDWTHEEHILAFNLYCKIPFGSMYARNPQIADLAKVIGRSPNSLALKLSNFARLDPELQARGIKGMSHGAKGEVEVWNEFEANPETLAFESERLLAQFTGRKLEEIAEIDERELPKEGLERERMVRVRVNQHFFRAAVLSAYDNKCCVTGLAISELLVASHIVPWATDAKQRMNPRNGLCLNALHDRAFDRGLMFIDETMSVRFREKIIRCEKKSPGLDWLLSYEGKGICMPRKFKPDPHCLSSHRISNETGK